MGWSLVNAMLDISPPTAILANEKGIKFIIMGIYTYVYSGPKIDKRGVTSSSIILYWEI